MQTLLFRNNRKCIGIATTIVNSLLFWHFDLKTTAIFIFSGTFLKKHKNMTNKSAILSSSVNSLNFSKSSYIFCAASVGCFHSFQYLCKPFYEAINIIERRKPREAHVRSIASSDNSRQKSKADFVYSTPSSSSRLLCKARRRDLKNHSVWLPAGNTVHSSGSSQEGTLMQSV